MEDQKIICCDCGRTFIFSVRDQEFFAKMGFYPPKRCRSCKQEKNRHNDTRDDRGRGGREFFGGGSDYEAKDY